VIQEIINSGKMKYVYKSTVQKMVIY